MSTRRRIVLSVAALVLVTGGLLTERWFVHPQTDDPGTADAIFVLGGGGDRVGFAVDLVREGVASEVVFASVYVEDEGVWAARPCNGRAPRNLADGVTFECREPEPGTTRGEARMLRDLATERGWETVVVVASTDQITRARRLIERCWDGEIRLTGPDHFDPWPVRALYEWGAGIKATLLRDC
ncbi:MAG: ElyC/SanA/YdcF family protein [Acidimicrobiales bacterium]